MQQQLRTWLVQAGFPEEIEVIPMRGGLGSTTLWTFSPAPHTAPLVVRVFPEGSDATADREYLAMRAAAAHGVPVPTIVTRGIVDSRPVLVTTFASGTPVTELLGEHPERAHALGLAMGKALGHLHKVDAPDGLVRRDDAWIDRGGPSLAPIRPLLAEIPNGNRLLHLDYHANNVLAQGDAVTAIIDWENTLAGPPHIDLARSRAILHAVKLGGLVPAAQQAAFDQMESGMVEGHTRVAGVDPHPSLSAAWGMAMTADDLAGQVGKPGSWVTTEVVKRLREERDRLIARVENRS